MPWNSIKWEVNLLKELVGIDTRNTGIERNNYQECASCIQDQAENLGLHTEIIDGSSVTEDKEPRPNVIIDMDKGSDITILFITHYDVVPIQLDKWVTDPFKLTIKGNKAYGRGAADDKSGIAIMLGAMRQLLKEDTNVNFKLCAACDEETGGAGGIEYLFNVAKIRGNAGVVVDAGPEYVGIGASGSVWGKVIVKGKGGHSGNPDVLDNPIYRTAKLVEELQKYHEEIKEKVTSRIRGPPSAVKSRLYGRFAISMIKAWQKENIIPGECEFRFDRRIIPEEDPDKSAKDAVSQIRKLAEDQGTKVEVEIINKASGYFTDPDHPWVQLFHHTVEKTLQKEMYDGADLGFDDGMYLAEVGIPVVTFGALRYGTNYHGHNEFVNLQDIQDCRDVMVNLGRAPSQAFNF